MIENCTMTGELDPLRLSQTIQTICSDMFEGFIEAVRDVSFFNIKFAYEKYNSSRIIQISNSLIR
jgi:hypothetical protein